MSASPENVAKLRVEVEGGDKSALSIQAVWEALRKLGQEAKASAEGPFKEAWESFRAGQAAGGSLEGTFKALTTAMRGPLGPVAALAVGFGAYALAAKHAADQTVEMYREFRSLGAVAGGTVEEVEGLINAFKLMGLPTESIRIAMFRLSIAAESDSESLRSLGIQTRDAAGMTKEPIALFKELAGQLDNVTNQAQKMAILKEVMGRAGVQMTAFFKMTKEQREDYIARGEEMSALDEEIIERTVQLMGKAGEAELAWKKFNAELARTAGFKMKETLYEIEAAMARLLTKTNAVWTSWANWLKLFPVVRSAMQLAGIGARAAGLVSTPPGGDEARDTEHRAAGAVHVPMSKEDFKRAELKLKHDEEMRRLELKGTADLEAERAQIESGFAFLSKERKMQETRDLIAEENKGFAEHHALLLKRFGDDANMQKELEKLTFAHQKRLLELEQHAAKQSLEYQRDKAKDFLAIQKEVVEKLKALEAEKAGIGGSLEDKALASLRKRGYKGTITKPMLEAEVTWMRQWGSYYARQSEAGKGLVDAQWQFMKEWQPGESELKHKHMTGDSMGDLFGAAGKTRALAYGGRMPPMAEMAADIQRQEFKILGDKFEKITEAIQGMKFVIDGQEFGSLVQDSLSRTFEFQSARQ